MECRTTSSRDSFESIHCSSHLLVQRHKLGAISAMAQAFQLLLCILGLSTVVAGSTARAQVIYADSVWLDYKNGLSSSGDFIITDMLVEETNMYTFFAALVWDTGYFGLQRGGSGYSRHIHFAIWDPPSGGTSTVLSKNENAVTERFGGEGTGLKVMLPFEYLDNVNYRFAVRLVRRPTWTEYTSFFFNPQTGIWTQIATAKRPEINLKFSYVASFVEDFGGNPWSRRSAIFKNGWLRKDAGSWVELKTAVFNSPGSKTDKDSDFLGNSWRLETGGISTLDTPVGTQMVRTDAPLIPIQHRLTKSMVSGQLLITFSSLPIYTYQIEIFDTLNGLPAVITSVPTGYFSQPTAGSEKFFRLKATEISF